MNKKHIYGIRIKTINSKNKLFRNNVYALAILAATASCSFATADFWSGSSSDDWTVAANWSAGKPVSSSSVYIESEGAGWPTLNDKDGIASTVLLEGTSTTYAQLFALSYSLLDVTSDIQIGNGTESLAYVDIDNSTLETSDIYIYAGSYMYQNGGAVVEGSTYTLTLNVEGSGGSDGTATYYMQAGSGSLTAHTIDLSGNAGGGLGIFDWISGTINLSTVLYLEAGGEFSWQGTSSVTSASLGGTVDFLGGNINVYSGKILTISSAADGSGGLKTIGAGTLILTASNTYTGGTIISAGILQIGNGGTTGSITGNVIDNGTLVFDRSDSGGISFSGSITGSGTVQQAGGTTLTLSGSNSYASLAISAGTVKLGSSSALPSGATLAMGGGASNTALDLGGYGVSLGSLGTLGGAGTATITNSGSGTAMLTYAGGSGSSTFAGKIDDDAPIALVVANGSLTLTNTSNNYSGGTTINGGNLQFGSGAFPGGMITINAGGALNIAGAFSTVMGALSSSSIVSSSSGAVALTGDSSENIDFTGYNNLALGAAVDSTYTGTITPGSNGYNLGGGGATLTLTNTNALTGTNSLVVGSAGSTGTVALTSSNDFAGSTTIVGGTLTVSNSSAIPDTSDVTVDSGATFNLASDETIGSLAGSGTVALGTNNLTTGADNAGSTFSGTLSSSGGEFIKSGTGTMVLSSSNTFSNDVLVSNGTLEYSNSGGTLTVSNINISSGATLSITAGTLDASAGASSTDDGTVNLSGNSDGTGAYFNGSNVYIGDSNGIGTFNHTGGTSTITNLYIGTVGNHSAYDTYELSGGILEISQLITGHSSSPATADYGSFQITGGTASIGEATLRYISDISQSGGTATINTLNISAGVYQLLGGTVYTQTVNITAGEFEQWSGTHQAEDEIQLSGLGTYFILGGTLEALGGVEIAHTGYFEFEGGEIYGDIDNHGTFIASGPSGGLYVNGNFTNESDGTLKVYGNSLVVTGTMICDGTYNSDPANNYFSSMIDGRRSAMKGSVGDHFFLSGDLLSKSRNRQHWNTQLAALWFNGGDGQHVMDVTGRDMGAAWDGYDNNFSWGLLSLASGQSLDLITKSGRGHAALYVGSLELADGLAQIADISTKHVNIYYDAEMNSWLGDATYSLPGGGKLIPVDGDNPLSAQFALVVAAVPEPSLGLGIACLFAGWYRSRRR